MIRFAVSLSCCVAILFEGFVEEAFAQQSKASPPSQSPAQVLARANQLTGEMDQLRSQLRSPDASARMAAMMAMVESDNPRIVEMAITESAANSDIAIRAVGLRVAFRSVKALAIEMTPADLQQHLSDRNSSDWEDWLGKCALGPRVQTYDSSSGQIAFDNSGCGGEMFGQVSGETITLSGHACRVTLRPIEAGSWRFSGRATCAWRKRSFNGIVTFDLR